MTFETIKSERKYQGRAFAVRVDEVRLPDGKLARWDVVEHVGAVTVLPIDEQGRVWFVRQHRQPAQMALLELPAGTLEPGEPPEVCAGREIREEIGMSAREIKKIGEFFLAPGYSTEYMHVYLATGLSPDPLPGDQDEFLAVQAVPLEQAYTMAYNGEIRDGKTLAALLLVIPQMRG